MVQCHQDSGDTYKKEMKTWAAGVGWNVREKGVMMKTVTYSNPKVASYCPIYGETKVKSDMYYANL